MLDDNFMSDIQAQSQSFNCIILFGMRPVKTFKNMSLLFFTHPVAFVSYRNNHLVTAAFYADHHRLLVRAVLYSVADQIAQHLFNMSFITVNLYLFLLRFYSDLMVSSDILLLNHSLHQLDNVDIFSIL